MTSAALSGRAVEFLDPLDLSHGPVDRHLVLLELAKYVRAAVGQEGDPVLPVPQPHPDRDPAPAQGHELRDRELVVPRFPGRHHPPADNAPAQPHAPVVELEPGQRPAGDQVPAHHAAVEQCDRIAPRRVDRPPAGFRPPDPEEQARARHEGSQHDDQYGWWHRSSQIALPGRYLSTLIVFDSYSLR